MSKQRVPYLCWRDGRPRWVPSPVLRARGFKGQDLKDAAGNWLSKGAAIDAAEKLNAQLKSSPSPLAGDRGSAHVPAEGGARSMNALFDLYAASPHFRRLARRTQSGYRLHLKLLNEWCGDLAPAQLTRTAIADLHSTLEQSSGAAQANAVLRTLKIALNYCITDLRWLAHNPAAKLEFAETEGRLVLFTADEIAALTATADALDLASIGDAITLAVLTCQREGDVLRLSDRDYKDGKFVLRTGKTSRLVNVPAVEALDARITALRARRAERWPDVKHTALVVCELTGAPYRPDGSRFRDIFRMIRAVTAGSPDARARVADILGKERAARYDNLLPSLAIAPAVAEKRFADLRDTGITWLFMAGCTVAEIATVTAHSLRTVQDILDKHYFVRNDALAQSAAAKFSRFLATQR